MNVEIYDKIMSKGIDIYEKNNSFCHGDIIVMWLYII